MVESTTGQTKFSFKESNLKKRLHNEAIDTDHKAQSKLPFLSTNKQTKTEEHALDEKPEIAGQVGEVQIESMENCLKDLVKNNQKFFDEIGSQEYK